MPTRRLNAVARFASILTLALVSAAAFVVARAHAGALPALPKSLLETKFMIFFLNPRYEWWEKVDSSEGGGDRLGWIGSDADKRDLFEKYTSEFIENLKNELWQRGFEKIGKDDGFPVSVLCLGVLSLALNVEFKV
jgi:hypothetical protein